MILVSFAQEHKIAVVKAVRTLLDIDLKSAKELVESCPVAINTPGAAEQLRAAGTTVEIRYHAAFHVLLTKGFVLR